MTRRRSRVAGSFYPDDPEKLEALLKRLIEEAAPRHPGGRVKALIVPHGAYVYSGAVAASAYALLSASAESIERVVLLGPSHRIRIGGLAATSAEALQTPLGDVPVDREAVASVLELHQVELVESAHTTEHSLEVQIPFLQSTLGDFSLVPLCVGDATTEEVTEVLGLLWGGRETLVVVSADLSHYFDHATAKRLDEATSRAIEALRQDRIGPESTCARNLVRALLRTAQQHCLRARTIDLRNSGDIIGPRDQVVGYGAFALA